jgi:MFS family permease
VGIGAVGGAVLLPALRARLSLNGLVAAASAAFALACLVLGLVPVMAIVVPALMLAGLAWIAVLSSLNASAQTLLPNWARARGLAYYTLIFMGGQALGAAAWGLLAQVAGVELALTLVAAGLAAGLLAARRYPLVPLDIDLSPARHWPEPNVVLDPEPDAGPVLVTVEYHVPPENAERFRAAMGPVERTRRRTGARRWELYQDGADPSLFVEAYTVATWEEHLRQHDERITVRDAELEGAAGALLAEGSEPVARHLFRARGR